MGYHLTTCDSARSSQPATKYLDVHRKTHRGPIFCWVLSSKYTDAETGLIYYGYRFLLPTTGKWASRDPIFESGGHNLYSACFNIPIVYVDFLGLNPAAIFGKCAASVISDKMVEKIKQAAAEYDFKKLIGNECPGSSDSSIKLPDLYKDWLDKQNAAKLFGECVASEFSSKLFGKLFDDIIKTKKLPDWIKPGSDLEKKLKEAADYGKSQLEAEFKKSIESMEYSNDLFLHYWVSNGGCQMNYDVRAKFAFTPVGIIGMGVISSDKLVFGPKIIDYNDASDKMKKYCMCECAK